ncbi:MAG: DUF2625 family protein [Candidatus Competibacteraceae bacterium]|nr:DUF2625 family protein [Candidatus Competibacteraceae bacterium]MBK8961854.1 DUF2625 family protein [Candidatus Competibacteraceae bacterium]MBK9951069.1 DUF2625 family protein [Candidatus Competibacteraceae bacterium]
MSLIEDLITQIETSKNNIEIIKNDCPDNILLNILQITDRSTLGTIIKFTNGILIKEKFLRLFGGNDSEWTDSIKKWNNIPGQENIDNIPSGCLFIGFDVVGGFFAINGGYFGQELGKVYYFAPDTLEWENLNMGYSDFISWCISGNVDKFYESFIWKNSEEIILNTKRGQGISFYPVLWSKEGKEINKTRKKIVPLKELWALNLEMKEKINV